MSVVGDHVYHLLLDLPMNPLAVSTASSLLSWLRIHRAQLESQPQICSSPELRLHMLGRLDHCIAVLPSVSAAVGAPCEPLRVAMCDHLFAQRSQLPTEFVAYEGAVLCEVAAMVHGLRCHPVSYLSAAYEARLRAIIHAAYIPISITLALSPSEATTLFRKRHERDVSCTPFVTIVTSSTDKSLGPTTLTSVAKFAPLSVTSPDVPPPRDIIDKQSQRYTFQSSTIYGFIYGFVHLIGMDFATFPNLQASLVEEFFNRMSDFFFKPAPTYVAPVVAQSSETSLMARFSRQFSSSEKSMPGPMVATPAVAMAGSLSRGRPAPSLFHQGVPTHKQRFSEERAQRAADGLHALRREREFVLPLFGSASFALLFDWPARPVTTVVVLDDLRSFVLTNLYGVLFKGPATKFKDEALHKRMATYDWVTPRHLDIGDLDTVCVRASLPRAMHEILAMNQERDPRAKLERLAACIEHLLMAINLSSGGAGGADVLMPVLIYVLLQVCWAEGQKVATACVM
jgi:hypothetical protein